MSFVSGAVMHDPEVMAWVERDGVQAETIAATIKGFESEHIELWAMTPSPDQPKAASPAEAAALAPEQPKLAHE